jgi:hypothetical protein
MDRYQKLEKLGALHSAGVLSDEEFQAEKRRILGERQDARLAGWWKERPRLIVIVCLALLLGLLLTLPVLGDILQRDTVRPSEAVTSNDRSRSRNEAAVPLPRSAPDTNVLSLAANREGATTPGEGGDNGAVEAKSEPPPTRATTQGRDLRSICARRRNTPSAGENAEVPGKPGHTWRCSDGIVLICNMGATGRACLRSSPVDAARMQAFEEYCRDNPGDDLPGFITSGLHSSWTCRGIRPQQTSAGSVDRDGYDRTAWRPMR